MLQKSCSYIVLKSKTQFSKQASFVIESKLFQPQLDKIIEAGT